MVKGKKRHLLVDTLGLILNVVVHAADVQDRDGAVLVLDRRTRRLFPFLEKIFADGAYGGEKLRKAMAGAAWTITVVKRSDTAKGFEVLPKRWVVERTIAWINRCRRLAEGLRKPQPNRSRLHPSRQHQAHAKKTHAVLLSHINFPDGL